jgi:hypothetical protein
MIVSSQTRSNKPADPVEHIDFTLMMPNVKRQTGGKKQGRRLPHRRPRAVTINRDCQCSPGGEQAQLCIGSGGMQDYLFVIFKAVYR